jgi:hypothetical protein
MQLVSIGENYLVTSSSDGLIKLFTMPELQVPMYHIVQVKWINKYQWEATEIMEN